MDNTIPKAALSNIQRPKTVSYLDEEFELCSTMYMLRVFLILLEHAGPNRDKCRISRNSLRERARIDNGDLTRTLQKLASAGLVEQPTVAGAKIWSFPFWNKARFMGDSPTNDEGFVGESPTPRWGITNAYKGNRNESETKDIYMGIKLTNERTLSPTQVAKGEQVAHPTQVASGRVPAPPPKKGRAPLPGTKYAQFLADCLTKAGAPGTDLCVGGAFGKKWRELHERFGEERLMHIIAECVRNRELVLKGEYADRGVTPYSVEYYANWHMKRTSTPKTKLDLHKFPFDLVMKVRHNAKEIAKFADMYGLSIDELHRILDARLLDK
jgi:hypothetical protein